MGLPERSRRATQEWHNPIAGDKIVRRTQLIEARERLGLNRNALGVKLGLYRGYITRVEEGVRNPSLEVMVRWAKFLDCSLDIFSPDAERAA